MESGFSHPPEPFTEAESCACAIAVMLIKIHGEKAGAEALATVNAMRQRSDAKGAAFWFKTFHAIDAMATSQNAQG